MSGTLKDTHIFRVNSVGHGLLQIRKLVIADKVKSISVMSNGRQVFSTAKGAKIYVDRKHNGDFLVRELSGKGRELIQLESTNIQELSHFLSDPLENYSVSQFVAKESYVNSRIN